MLNHIGKAGFLNMKANLKKFDDVIGFEEVKEYIKKNVFVRKKGDKSVETIMLYGPDGCGKSMIAKAVAGESGSEFVSFGPEDLLSEYLGDGNLMFKKIFSGLEKNDKTVMYIDDSERIFGEDSKFKKTFLELLKETEDKKKNLTCFIGTCLPWKMDKEVIEKIDVSFYLSIPDKEKILQTVKQVFEHVPVDPNLDEDSVADSFNGHSFEEIKEVCRKAAGKMFNRALETGSHDDYVKADDIKEFLSDMKKINSEEYLVKLDNYSKGEI